MIPARFHYGDAHDEIVMTGDQVISTIPRVWTFLPDVDGRILTLPDARRFLFYGGVGSNVYVFFNIFDGAGARTLTVEDNLGADIGIIVKGAVAKLHLMVNTTQAGDWRFQLKT